MAILDAPCTCSVRRSRRPCWYSTPMVFRAAGGRKSPRPFSMGYGRGLTVCRCRLPLRSLECLETARKERKAFIAAHRKGKRYGDVTFAIVTQVTIDCRDHWKLRQPLTAHLCPMSPQKTQTKPAPANALESLWNAYSNNTSKRLKFIDSFLVFLVLSGIVQFLYCILVTNFPFNAFLAG